MRSGASVKIKFNGCVMGPGDSNQQTNTMRIQKLQKELLLRVQDLMADNIEECEHEAAKVAQHDDSDKPVKGKLAFSCEWEVGSERPAIKVTCTYSVKHSQSMEARLDLDQTAFDFEDGEE